MKKIILALVSGLLVGSCGTSKMFTKKLQNVSILRKILPSGGNLKCTPKKARNIAFLYSTSKSVMDGIIASKRTAKTLGKDFKLDKEKFCKAKKNLDQIEWEWVLDDGRITFEESKTLGPGIWYYDSIKDFGCSENQGFTADIKVRDRLNQAFKLMRETIDKEGKVCS